LLYTPERKENPRNTGFDLRLSRVPVQTPKYPIGCRKCGNPQKQFRNNIRGFTLSKEEP
jgi:hypothetical protein